MNFDKYREYRSHGDGLFSRRDLKSCGTNVVIEDGVRIFHPENVCIGDNVYVGHGTMLKGYYTNEMVIGNHTWIGQNCLLHSAGGLCVGSGVGIGPMTVILTSQHSLDDKDTPVLFNDLVCAPVIIEDGCDIGARSVILPGVRVGEGSVIGAGAVASKDIDPYTVAAGVPARVIRKRS